MRTEVIHRHAGLVRATHWINAIALLVLLMSGLQIFNAHPALYWGEKSTFASPWLAIEAAEQAGGGVSRSAVIAGRRFGISGGDAAGQANAAAFPGWMTLPSGSDLAIGRRWHFLLAWVFAINLLIYFVSGMVSGHFRRDLLPSARELTPRAIGHDVAEHLRLRFPRGDTARSYNVLQKLSYLGVFGIILPIIVLTGCTMSPAVDALAPWLVGLFGGRQSARTIHFLMANLVVLFVVVHLAMVMLSGAWNNMRSMVTGRYILRFEDRVHDA